MHINSNAGHLLSPERPDSWDAQAACRTEDPEMWFPDPADHVTASKAKAICAGCPVTTQCREWAESTDQKFGIWGGVDEDERRNAKRRTRRREKGEFVPRKPIEHGSVNGYAAHRRRKQAPCQECSAAHSRAVMERRKPMSAPTTRPAVCGADAGIKAHRALT